MTRPSWRILLAVVVFMVALATAVVFVLHSGGGETSGSGDLAGREQVMKMLHDQPQTVVPAQLPAGTVRVAAVMGNGNPNVDIYQSGEPAVTVCVATVSECRRSIPDGEILRQGVVEGQNFAVLVNPREAPSGGTLSGSAKAFWSGVAFGHQAGWVGN